MSKSYTHALVLCKFLNSSECAGLAFETVGSVIIALSPGLLLSSATCVAFIKNLTLINYILDHI